MNIIFRFGIEEFCSNVEIIIYLNVKISIDGGETLIPRSSRVICCCYDNKMHGVAWAQVHSMSFPADQNINFNSMDKFKFWTDFEKEIEFWKCSFKLLNVMLIKKSNLWPY